ncbi:hypothetical protein CF326_g10024, partial [Tilletia indica]
MEQVHGILSSTKAVSVCVDHQQAFIGRQEQYEHALAHLHDPSIEQPSLCIATFGSSIVSTGECPFCFWDEQLPATDRVRSETNSEHQGMHVVLHIISMLEPFAKCPFPYCAQTIFVGDLPAHLAGEHSMPLCFGGGEPAADFSNLLIERTDGCRSRRNLFAEWVNDLRKAKVHLIQPEKGDIGHGRNYGMFGGGAKVLKAIQSRRKDYLVKASDEKKGQGQSANSASAPARETSNATPGPSNTTRLTVSNP